MTLSALLLEYLLPCGPAFMGLAAASLSVYVNGAQERALWVFGLAMIVTTPIYAAWGVFKEARLQEQLRGFNDLIVKKQEPELTPIYPFDVPALKPMIKGMDAFAVEYIAQAVMSGRPFTERTLTGKGRLTPSVYDETRGRLVTLRYLIPGKARQRARWSREGLEFLRDVTHGRVGREMTPPPPPPSIKILRLVE